VQGTITSGHLDIGEGGVRMLGGVGQRLGHHVVGGDLDWFGQPPLGADIEADRDGGAAGQRLQRRAQPDTPAVLEARANQYAGWRNAARWQEALDLDQVFIAV
jgi:hypothetical protein